MNLRAIRRVLGRLILILCMIFLLGSSTMPPGDNVQQARAFTRRMEFDYVNWTLDALGVKLNQLALGTADYLSQDQRHQLVVEYLTLVTRLQQIEAQLSDVYSDPGVTNRQAASYTLSEQYKELRARREKIGPVAEGILQSQISQVLDSLGLTLGGQPVPPVLYHSTPLPWALIISPRNAIRQEADISLEPALTVDKQVALEEQVDHKLNVSSLVVGIGGVGVYPTMVQQTGSLDWLAEVVSHEWVHNFLTLRPLGASYMNSPELRTMNETVASIAGKEIGRVVLERFYPELLLPKQQAAGIQSGSKIPAVSLPVFDFRAEMHETRVNVDEMLAKNQVEDAEKYMDQQQAMFWENGYHLRKLNQAYFAFYGAYADQPGGAAGADPIGSAVRALRAASPSLAAFLNQVSWMSSFQQLQKAVGEK